MILLCWEEEKRHSRAEGELAADPVAKRARRNVEHCAFCIRTFVDKESLKKHMQDNHFD